jgi:hypothetical protein
VINPVLVKLLVLALNLMPLGENAFSFHVVEEGYYAATYRAERRDADFTLFRPLVETEGFLSFEAEKSRRFGRSYTVRVYESGELFTVSLTDIMKEMPSLAAVPRQILQLDSGTIKLDGAGRCLFLAQEGENFTVVAEIIAPL